MYTNININHQNYSFNYIVEYQKTNILNEKKFSYNSNSLEVDDMYLNDKKLFYNKTTNQYIYHNLNEWIPVKNKELCEDYFPESGVYKISNLNIYFPVFSVDTIQTNISYAVSASIRIRNIDLILTTQIINRIDATVVDSEKVFLNDKYYDIITIPIIDPYDMLYSDDWKSFRMNVCGEQNDDIYINNDAPSLYITIYPVKNAYDRYIKLDNFIGGQNSIPLFPDGNQSNFLNISLNTNINSPLINDDEPSFNCKINFNNYYDDLQEYMKETYGMSDINIRYELYIGNETDLYAVVESDIMDSNVINYEFKRSKILNDTNNFTSFDGWKEGIYVVSSVFIKDLNNIERELQLTSNKIPLTQDIYRFFNNSSIFNFNKKQINNINLDLVNMNIYHINAINKIDNTVVKLDHNNIQTNISHPVFFRAQDSSNITIHPEVTENICINLDAYKGKVESFRIKINNTIFNEIGRISAGILFKIIGAKLPKSHNEGTYYILNQDNELVTMGKYKCVV